MGKLLGSRDPRPDRANDLDTPITADWEISPRNATPDATTRIESKGDCAPRFARVPCAIGSIAECTAGNTNTAFPTEIVGQIPFTASGCGDFPHHARVFARIKAFPPNAPITSAVAFQIGAPAVVVLTESYNGSNRVALYVWRPSDMADWALQSPDAVFTAGESDFDDCVIDWAPSVLGFAFPEDSPGGNAIIGARVDTPRQWKIQACFAAIDENRIIEAGETPEGGCQLRGRTVRIIDARTTYCRPRHRPATNPKSPRW